MTETIDIAHEYAFSKLSDAAKQFARNAYTSDNYPDYDWWDNVYEDANQIAKILGLDIESTKVNKKGKTYVVIDINFSGFCSQGDGADFKGSYQFNPEAVNVFNFEGCIDEELIRIATELTAMQLTQRLLGCEPFRARVSTSKNIFAIDDWGILDWGIDEVGEPNEEQFAQLMRDFANWIYKTLETEHDYLTSDEVVDERLAEEKFDVDGLMI